MKIFPPLNLPIPTGGGGVEPKSEEICWIRWAVENDSEFFLTLKLWVSSWNLYFVIHDNINILFLSCHTVQYFVTRENTSNKFHLFLSFGHLYFVTRKNTKKF